MARYPLKLPLQLKEDAEQWASKQGISLNQFIMWAVAEKVGALNNLLDDPAFPRITYQRSSSGLPVAYVAGSRIRVQTIVIAHTKWNYSVTKITRDYGIGTKRVKEALSFYLAHQDEIDAAIEAEEEIEEGVVAD